MAKKYIDVEETIEYCAEHIDGNIGLIASNAIKGVSPADVVEVVRCKDCKEYSPEYSVCNNSKVSPLQFPHREPNDYCSYGERKGGEE